MVHSSTMVSATCAIQLTPTVSAVISTPGPFTRDSVLNVLLGSMLTGRWVTACTVVNTVLSAMATTLAPSASLATLSQLMANASPAVQNSISRVEVAMIVYQPSLTATSVCICILISSARHVIMVITSARSTELACDVKISSLDAQAVHLSPPTMSCNA